MILGLLHKEDISLTNQLWYFHVLANNGKAIATLIRPFGS